MYRIIQSAKVAKCDQTGELGIIIDGKVYPLGGNGGGSADWNASEGEAGHVKNRTHYEETTVVNEPLNITWDGNTDGLVSVGEMYKVSDLVLTDEQIKTVIETISTGETAILSEEWDYLVADGCVTEDVVFGEYATYVRTAGIEIDGATIPEAGIYFMSVDGWAHVSSLTTTEPVPQTKTVVHKLDKKFLPDDEGGGGESVTEYEIKESWDSSANVTYACDLAFDDAYAMGAEGIKNAIIYCNAHPTIVVASKSMSIGSHIILRFIILSANSDMTITETVQEFIWTSSGFTKVT